ncbi:MAG: hypothetical protein GYA21_02890 [Myxococcales bacterium]|nr:hypothetical protein [Myxococcales bacterium]
MRYLRLGPVVLASLVAISACDGGGASGPIPLQNSCSEYQKAICDLLERCELSIMFEMENHARCQDALGMCDEGFQRMVDSVNAGRIRYDGTQARTCLDQIKALSCLDISEVFDNELEACQSVFTGLVTADADCYFSDECAAGLYCDESTSQCPGKCRAYAGSGASCVDSECDPAQAECNGSVCVPLAGPGQPCDNVSCAEGLNCDSSTSPARCVAPGEEGSACASEDQCRNGLRCINQKCAGPASAKETCVIEEFGEFFLACETGLYCDADIVHQQDQGACQPKKGQGEPCVLFYECQPEFLCIGTTVQTGQVTPGRCQPPVTEGGSCYGLLGEGRIPECRYDLWCNPQTGKCEALPGEGGTCTEDKQPDCKNADLYCDISGGSHQGVCRAKKAEGQPCQDWEECQSDRCVNDTCAPRFSCAP